MTQHEILLNTTKLMEDIKQAQEKDEQHLKGYIYDSLVYRYQLALYKASLKDTEDLMIRKCISRKEAEAQARNNYIRDMMRFCEILNEAIGEHD